MKLIVGLGNPGEKYEKTRHNLGFVALDSLLEKFESAQKTFWEEKKDLKSQIKIISHLSTLNSQLLLAKPTTFMNNSGFAVSKILNYYKIAPFQMIIIHDDSDLLLGKIRVRFGGASGGHRGVQSIIETIKTDKFLRVRLGIGRPAKIRNSKFEIRNSLDRYVLAPFSAKDKNAVKHMIKEATRAILVILEKGLDAYLSRYHSK